MSDTTFVLDQKVVYPSQGVGIIREISEKTFKGTPLLYYRIYLEVTDMVIMVPVSRVEELGIRAIVPPSEAQAALELIGEEGEPITSDWKLRYQMNLDLLKKGTVCDIATIVRTLYHRSKVKDLSISERKLYDSAKKLLEDEISYALDMSAKEVEGLIHAKLEPNGIVIDDVLSELGDEFADDDLLEDEDGEEKKAKAPAAEEDDDDDDDDEEEEETPKKKDDEEDDLDDDDDDD
jgi:CarD family transcriptional regulator